ncbi:MAG: NADP-dependent malate dehydrogenase [uncultured bacterium]|nr:MAG: NADP-dependent malate dehydrogenase [uncultured bacterium]HBY73198.1 malate dehydrogenase [Candidatus Kerfeldbacteria bacterium]
MITKRIETHLPTPLRTQRDLSLLYTPGVGEPAKKIARQPRLAYSLTNKRNLVAVISNGTAVLGLGNIGPLAAKPVMEGKAALFKRFAGIDAFDLEIAETDPDKFIDIVAKLVPTFGGINLEDIAAPACFYIETELQKRINIPVFHDDQHGTAIISGAALLNALELVHKKIGQVHIVISGAGAAGIRCAEHYVRLGAQKKNITLCDSHGIVSIQRRDLDAFKKQFAVNTSGTLADALVNADVFVGVSAPNIVTPAMIQSMAKDPIVFAMANPDPEIAYPLAKRARHDILLASGRSDYPNQINNVLGFPFVFRGALDVSATRITEEMKLAATYALAELAHRPVPASVKRAYRLKKVQFGYDYIVPKPFDPRLLAVVSTAVAKTVNPKFSKRQLYHYGRHL